MEFKVGGNADKIADIRAYGIAFCGKKKRSLKRCSYDNELKCNSYE